MEQMQHYLKYARAIKPRVSAEAQDLLVCLYVFDILCMIACACVCIYVCIWGGMYIRVCVCVCMRMHRSKRANSCSLEMLPQGLAHTIMILTHA